MEQALTVVKETKKRGRPSKYSKAVVDEICERLIAGESLRTICLDEKMPAAANVYLWLQKDAIFREQYARARMSSAEAMAEDILDIADDGTNDWMEINGREVVNNEAVQRSKLRVDTRKWLMSKLLPKKYGDKLDVTSDGEPIVTKVLNYYAADNKPDARDNTSLQV